MSGNGGAINPRIGSPACSNIGPFICMHHNFPDEHALVNALQRHSSSDFALLYQRYAATLYRVLLRLVNDPMQAQDLLQDTFITIWLNHHRYNPARGRLFTWFLILTRNIAFDALKANQRRLAANAYHYDNYEESISSIRFEGRIDEPVLSGLAPKYRLVIELIYGQGYTRQEVADHLNLPLGTVKTRLRLALQQLRAVYQQDIYRYYQE